MTAKQSGSMWDLWNWLREFGIYRSTIFGQPARTIYITYIRVYISLYPEKAMAPHSSTLARKIPWAEEPARLQSRGSLRVGHD